MQKNKQHCNWDLSKAVCLVLTLITPLFFSSCGAEEIRKLGAGVAAQGQLTCEKAILLYEKLESWQRRLKDEDIKVKILTHPAPDELRITQVASLVSPLSREANVRKKLIKH